MTRANGYELRLDPARLDAYRFERLLTDGRGAVGADHADRAVALLEEALALWRGDALADLAYEPSLQHEIARLEELRLSALEELVEAKLGLAQHADVIGQLETLIGQHPYRERLRAQLMLALYRADRQADALQAYQHARRTLVDELGIEPGERLRALERAILAQSPGLAVRAPDRWAAPDEPARQPASAFVGRGRELAQLFAGLEEAGAGRGCLCLLVGEPGIGKSRLAEEVIARAHARGARVLIGRCWEAGGAPAYWPWVQAVRTHLRASDDRTLRSQLGQDAASLVQIIPELGIRFPDLPAPSEVDSEGVRFRSFDAMVRFLRKITDDRPVVLFLDDLHAADPASLLLLRFLTRELSSIRMLALAAYRDVDPVPGQALSEMATELGREPVTRRLALHGLSEGEVAEYVKLTASDIPSAELVKGLYAETEGNPLFVGEIVRLLAVESVLTPTGGEPGLPIPQTIRDVIARRLSHVSDECRRMLLLASVIGRDFSLETLARMGGVSDDALLDLLDEAFGARVIADEPDAIGRLRFAHVLIRDTLYDGLASVRRVRLHGLAVEALEQLNDARPGQYMAELAHHAVAAHAYDKALRYARGAAGQALELRAYEEAARLFKLALQALAKRSPADAELQSELLLAAGDAFAKAGSMADAKETFLTACELARTTRLPEIFARAALGYGGSPGWQRAGTDSRLVPLLDEALNVLGREPSTLRARLLARLAGARRDEASLEPRSSLSREAVAIARELGEEETLVYTLTSLFMATWGPDTDELVAITEEVARLAEHTGSAEAALDALTLKGVVGWLTLADEAESMDTAYDALAANLGQAAPKWQGAMQNALWALFRGDFATAEQLEREALRSGYARSSDADCSYRLAMFLLRRAQGRLSEVDVLIREAVDRYPGYRSFRCFIPLLELEQERVQEARRAFDELAEADFAALPRDCEWLFCLSLLAEVAAFLHDRVRADVLYRLLEPFAPVNAMAAGEVALGPVARYLGVLATTTSRWEAAAGHFEYAIAISARLGARPSLAHSRHDYARMLIARDQPGDRDDALKLLTDAISTYQELGMPTWAEGASRQSRLLSSSA